MIHPGWFILDNASQGFTIDPDYARQISLQSSGSAAARGGGSGTVQAGVVRDVQISLPGLELTHRNLLVIELKALEPVIGHEIDGIIGSRLFDDFVVVVEYERRCYPSIHPTSTSPRERERHSLSVSISTVSHSLTRRLRYPASSPSLAVF
jgi:hypothetical protein